MSPGASTGQSVSTHTESGRGVSHQLPIHPPAGGRFQEKVILVNLDTGYRVQIPTVNLPVALERITNITNTGKRSINDEDIHIAIDNNSGTKILQTMIFYESSLSQHELISDEDGSTFRIKLKNFNPHDTLSVLVTSQRQVGISVNSKGSGFTFHSTFKEKGKCDFFSTRTYGGVVAYSKLADGCTIDRRLNLECSITENIRIPPDFPPGRAVLRVE